MCSLYFFFFNDTATTEIYTLSLHDALPILCDVDFGHGFWTPLATLLAGEWWLSQKPSFFDSDLWLDRTRTSSLTLDRKSTRLNSSHANISYAVFCLKKKKKIKELSQ